MRQAIQRAACAASWAMSQSPHDDERDADHLRAGGRPRSGRTRPRRPPRRAAPSRRSRHPARGCSCPLRCHREARVSQWLGAVLAARVRARVSSSRTRGRGRDQARTPRGLLARSGGGAAALGISRRRLSCAAERCRVASRCGSRKHMRFLGTKPVGAWRNGRARALGASGLSGVGSAAPRTNRRAA